MAAARSARRGNPVAHEEKVKCGIVMHEIKSNYGDWASSYLEDGVLRSL
jgi:hypothetical protein